MLEQVGADWRTFEPLELPPILEGAVAAFHAHGYHGTSVRDIAGRVKLTVPALYYHYGSKEGMLVALQSGSVQHLYERLLVAVEDAGPDASDRFDNFVECVVLFMAHRRKLAVLDHEIRALSTANRRAYAKIRRQVEDLLLDIVTDGLEAGVFKVAHPDDTVRALLGMLQAVSTWYDPAGALSPAQLAERYVEITRQTVGAQMPEPAARPRARRRTGT